MEEHPNRNSKRKNGDEALPGPGQHAGLHRENGDHEVIHETRVAQKRAVPWISPAKTAHQRSKSYDQSEDGNRDIDRQKDSQVEIFRGVWIRCHVLKRPVRTGPDEAESGLKGGAVGSFRRGQLVDDPAKIQGHDTPHHFGMAKWRDDQFQKFWSERLKHGSGVANRLPKGPP